MGKLAAALTVFAVTVACLVKIANVDPTGTQATRASTTRISRTVRRAVRRLDLPMTRRGATPGVAADAHATSGSSARAPQGKAERETSVPGRAR